MDLKMGIHHEGETEKASLASYFSYKGMTRQYDWISFHLNPAQCVFYTLHPMTVTSASVFVQECLGR